MSKIFELFGYRLDAWGNKADENRANAHCPFMGCECDGGGNRHLSAIDLSKTTSLQKYFPNKSKVQAGVCSLQIKENEQPWIVCPRRLFAMRGESRSSQQEVTQRKLVDFSGLPKGVALRAWSEVKMKLDTKNDDDEAKSFDYTFDYIIAGSRRVELSYAAQILGKSEKVARKIAIENGYTLAMRPDGKCYVEDFPGGPVLIVEIMTSSTSGGDKNKRTQVAMAFEDAVLHPENHKGPGINYRQVWARMVSQLIVKSQVGLAWNGKTVWLVQDVLADYISSSTALNLRRYISEHSGEVNILAMGYGASGVTSPEIDEISNLGESVFYAGPVGGNTISGEGQLGFIDIIKIGAPPSIDDLWRSLFGKRHCGNIKT